MERPDPTRHASPAGVAGWILFDCATQPYFTLVLTFVFAPYFASAVAPDPVTGQALWGFATAAAGLLIALTAPLLGAIADVTGPRKPWIAGFGAMLVLGASALWFAVPGVPSSVPLALVAFAVASVGVEYATVFNNSMMATLVPPERLGRLSGTGWAVGYVGGLVSLVLTLGFLAASPETGRTLIGLEPLFGLDAESRAGDRASGPLTALWFVVFVMPLFLFTPDVRRAGLPIGPAVRRGVGDLLATLRTLPQHRDVALFLVANMIYADGLLALFSFGGVYAAGVFGWTTTELGLFGILLTITGTVGAFFGGRLDDRLGPKPVVIGALVLLIACVLAILSVDADTVLFVIPVMPPAPGDGLYASVPEQVYLVLGALIGIAAGPVQAASRTLLVRLAPEGRTTQFFGLFALTGKITSFLGPLTVGLATTLTGSQRLGVAPLLVFFGIGVVLLARVRVR